MIADDGIACQATDLAPNHLGMIDAGLPGEAPR